MRTGAIFARGSCRALKWLALVGVVFALGGGSALAQTFTATTQDMAQGYSGKIVTIMVVDGDGDPVPVWGTPLPAQFVISATNNAVMGGGIGGLSATEMGATNKFTLTFVNDVVAGTDTITFTDPGAPATGEADRRLFRADDGTTTDADTDPDAVSISATSIAEAVTAPDLPLRLDDYVVEQGEEFTDDAPLVELPKAVENSGVGAITYSMTGTLPTTLSFDATTRKITGTVDATAEARDYPVSYTAVDTTPTTVSRSFTITVAAPLALPGKPQNLMAMPGDGEVVLSWAAPPDAGDDSGGAVESYEYDQNASGNWMDAGMGLTKTVTGLTNGTTYLFQVRAKNRKGTGPATAGVSATPVADPVPLAEPGVPQNLIAAPGDGKVTLSWEAPTTGGAVASYQYEQDASGNWMDAGTGLMKEVSSLTNGTSYVFRLRAVNATGNSAATDAVKATPVADPVPLAEPGMPQNLEAAPGNGEVTLSWEAPSSGGAVASYEYDMNADGDAMDAGTGLTKMVTGLTNGDTYVFRVRAKNATGVSGWTETVTAMPTSTSVDEPVTVKSVSTSATSVPESGGLEVTVVANVPAGTKGADGKVAPIASKVVTVSFPTSSTDIKAGEGAEDADTTVLGDSTGDLVWTKITRTEKASEQTYKFRVAINQDLDAEDEKFQVEVSIDGASKKSKVVTVTDAEDQEYELSLPAAAKGKIKEGAAAVKLSLTAKPSRTMPIDITLALNPNDPSKYTLGATEGTLPVGGTFSTTIAAKADKNREEDTVTVAAYMAGTLGNDEMLDELEIPVTDINALPTVKATLVDDDGDALDPQPESVTEGETVKVMLTAVDEDGKAMKAAEKLTIMLVPTGTADSADYRLSPNSIEIAKDKESSAAVDLMLTEDQDIGVETLTFNAIVAGEDKNGTEKKSVMGILSLMVEDGTMKLVWAKTQEEVEAAVYAAKEAGAGADDIFSPGEMMEVMGSALFSSAEGVTLAYTASPDAGAVKTSTSGGMVTVTAMEAGMAHVTITAHATASSGVKILPQSEPDEASIMFPVEVGLEALSIMLSGPENMDLVEGMSAEVTATANRAATEDVTVMVMRDRAMSSADDMDYTLDPEMITIMAGEMTGSTMVMAVEDNMMEDMEELVLYGMTEGMAGEVTGEVHLHLWDAAVPALPVIAQLLLAAFLAVGGYRRYRRR